MPRVGVIFEIRCAETLPGETVRVVGALPELGAWDPCCGAGHHAADEDDILRLRTGALAYPHWFAPGPVWLRFDADASECKQEVDRVATELSLGAASTVDGIDGEVTPSPASSSSFADAVAESAPSLLRFCHRTEGSHEAFSDKGGKPGFLTIEYKFLRDLRQLVGEDSSASFLWEEQIDNRLVAVPKEPGSLWRITDDAWNSTGSPVVERIAHADVVSRCLELDAESTLSPFKAKMISFCLTPPLTPDMEGSSCRESFFAIEDEFEALAGGTSPELLAKTLARKRVVGELASELEDLPCGHAMLDVARRGADAEEAAALRDEVAHLRDAMAGMAGRLEVLSGEHAEEVQVLRMECSEARGENERLQLRLEEVGSDLKGSLKENAQLQLRLEEFSSELRDMRDGLACADKEGTGLRCQNELLRSQLGVVGSELQDVRDRLSGEAEEASALKKENERLRSWLEELSPELKSATAALRIAEKESSALRDQNAQLQLRLEESGLFLKDAREDARIAAEEVSQLREKNVRLLSQLEETSSELKGARADALSSAQDAAQSRAECAQLRLLVEKLRLELKAEEGNGTTVKEFGELSGRAAGDLCAKALENHHCSPTTPRVDSSNRGVGKHGPVTPLLKLEGLRRFGQAPCETPTASKDLKSCVEPPLWPAIYTPRSGRSTSRIVSDGGCSQGEDAAAAAKGEVLLMQVRSSLSSATMSARGEVKADTELMQVLRRQREKIQC